MNILILGDVAGPAGVKAVKERLPQIIKKKKVDFVIINGENAADTGRGITKVIFEEFLKAGADVVTHVTENSIMGDKNPFDTSCAAVMEAEGDAEASTETDTSSSCGENALGYVQLDGSSGNSISITSKFDSGDTDTVEDSISLE